MYKHPGVYIEHVPSGALAIEAASTSVAVFIGPVKRGPVNTPELILNRGAYATGYGELDDATSGIRDLGDTPDYFGHAVNAFYDNGGRQAYIVRVAKDDATSAVGALADPNNPGAKGLYFSAVNEGIWGNKLVARIAAVDDTDLTLGYDFEVGYETTEDDGGKEFNVLETFSGVSTDPNSGSYLPAILGKQSTLINCEHLDLGGANGGAQITAIRGGSLHEFNVNDLKGKIINMTVNGTEIKVKFVTNLTDIEVTHGTGASAVTETHALTNPMDDLESVIAALRGAMNAHSLIDGFGAYTSGDAEVVFVPPADPANTPTSITTVSGAAATALKLLAPDVSNVAFPGASRAYFINGGDGGTVGGTDYDDALEVLKDYRDISIVVLPGAVWEGTGKDVINKAITHCEYMKNRVLIVDPLDPSAAVVNKLTNPKEVKVQGFPTSSYSSLYYPWIEVTNPHYDPEIAANKKATVMIPPSGFAAGMWARIDASRGVWKAPAGLEATVRGSQGPNILIGNDLQDQLNEWGVNCVRNIIGPPVIWGARTLATKVKPDQRYVPVRRTSIMIGESLYNALQAVVFEPNKHTLWAALRAGAGDFMESLYRAGAFQGEKASDAYYVKCGLGQTMTQADIDGGIVRLVVGYAPLKPAEFVVVQIKQIVGQRG
ncbi:phage tail sheath family protein [Palleronia caenipelagi]|uniref:Phage tail sheath protein n=1 Tax=Palleronia caenipelagi TaxID=2489174 RepID=A0A547PPP0_9RHOB|nr:phage tail sheath subtilisin-like domain-containing protein [Palleronia caenipelagi]TRD16118.1 phage tail sheath protein [Palleronia caenipelagi]